MPVALFARAMAISAPSSDSAGAAVMCWWVCACAAPRTRILVELVGSQLTTKAAPPSDTGQQSSSFERRGNGLRGHHVGDGDRVVKLRAGMGRCVLAHQHGEFGKIFLRRAVFMHVSVSNEAVIGRYGRAERNFVGGMADLCQRLDRYVAALAGEPVLAADHEDMSWRRRPRPVDAPASPSPCRWHRRPRSHRHRMA